MLFSSLGRAITQGFTSILSPAYDCQFIKNNIVQPFMLAANNQSKHSNQPYLASINGLKEKETKQFQIHDFIQWHQSSTTQDLRAANSMNSQTLSSNRIKFQNLKTPRAASLSQEDHQHLSHLIHRFNEKVVIINQDELGSKIQSRLATIHENSTQMPEINRVSHPQLSQLEARQLSLFLQKCCIRPKLINVNGENANQEGIREEIQTAVLIQNGASAAELTACLKQKLGTIVDQNMIQQWLKLIQMEKTLKPRINLKTPNTTESPQSFINTNKLHNQNDYFYKSCILDLHPLIELCVRAFFKKIHAHPAATSAIQTLNTNLNLGYGDLHFAVSKLNEIKNQLLKSNMISLYLQQQVFFQQSFPMEAQLQARVHTKARLQQTISKPSQTPLNEINTVHSSLVQNQKFELGNFTVVLNSSDTCLIKITTITGKVFASPPGKSFLIAGDHNLIAIENRGSFKVTENTVLTHDHQHITSVQASKTQLIIHGLLSDTSKHDAQKPRSKTTATKTFTLTLQKSLYDPNTLSFQIKTEPESHLLKICLASHEQESIYGMGEQYTHLNLKGQFIPVLAQENGIGRSKPALSWLVNTFSPYSSGTQVSSYSAAPFMFNGQSRGLFLTNKGYTTFDFQHPDQIQISAFDKTIEGEILSGSTKDCVAAYTRYSGRARPFLPPWTQKGAITGLQGGRHVVEQKIKDLQTSKVPITAVWLQDMVGCRVTLAGSQLWWNWEVDETHYPRWDEMVAGLNAQDIKVLGYINPYLVDPKHKPHKRNLFHEALIKNYLVKNKDNSPYMITNTDFEAVMVDLSNPHARRWYKDILKTEYIQRGLSGWMADFSEGLPFDAVMFNGSSGAEFHHHYIEAWAQLNQEAIDEADKSDEIVFFTRAGFTQTPKYSPMSWSGDQLATWDHLDGLKSAINSTISASAHGYSNHHTDIGGYTTIDLLGVGVVRKPELFYRWMEFATFTPIFRSHEGLRPQVNIQSYSNHESRKKFSKWAKLYAQLASYRHEMAKQTASAGTPLVRHMSMEYPMDDKASAAPYQYMFGDDFLVAPMVDPLSKGSTRRVYLPEGHWTHLFTQEKHALSTGGYVKQEAVLDCPPVYFKSDSQWGHNISAYIQQSTDFA